MLARFDKGKSPRLFRQPLVISFGYPKQWSDAERNEDLEDEYFGYDLWAGFLLWGEVILPALGRPEGQCFLEAYLEFDPLDPRRTASEAFIGCIDANRRGLIETLGGGVEIPMFPASCVNLEETRRTGSFSDLKIIEGKEDQADAAAGKLSISTYYSDEYLVSFSFVHDLDWAEYLKEYYPDKEILAPSPVRSYKAASKDDVMGWNSLFGPRIVYLNSSEDLYWPHDGPRQCLEFWQPSSPVYRAPIHRSVFRHKYVVW